MDIDLRILRMLEREKEISFDVLVEAIEQALLTAYHKTPGAEEHARVELDRKTGHVTVLAQEVDEEGNPLREWDDTPEGFGRIAATTAKQIMLQRLRDAEDDIRYGEFSGKEGEVNKIVLVSDGIETCGGDPVAAAEELNRSGIEVEIDVVGFGVPDDEADQLRDVASAGGGEYFDARTGALLEYDQALAGNGPHRLNVPSGALLSYTLYLASGRVDALGQRP